MVLLRSNYPTINNLFNDFFNTELGDWSRHNFSASNTTLPKVNIKEDDNGFLVEMAAPGMEKKDFNIKLENNVLTVSSEKGDESEAEQEKYTRKEFAFQSFQRSFTLPDTAHVEKTVATYRNGILSIQIPKKEEAKPKPPKSINIS
jgi:HSP20 family protein